MLNTTPLPFTATGRRPSFPESSRILVGADKRIRDLADTMLRLNGEGACTEALLLAEGFSLHELTQHADAARKLANTDFVREVAEYAAAAPLKTDEELIAQALDKVGGLLDPGQVVAGLRAIQFTHDTIARIWPKLMVKLATAVATLPVPGAPH